MFNSFLMLFLIAGAWASPASAVVRPREIGSVDNPDQMNAGIPLERNLQTLDQSVSKSTLLDIHPWSNGTWSLSTGLIANRYTDANYLSRLSWSDRHDYVVRNPMANVLNETDPERRARRIDALSPAEKYDLLVGDTQGTLTQALWKEGETRFKAGTLEGWMGICEGTAAASVLYPEPSQSVELKTPTGDSVRFHILDIKALAGMLWSSYNTAIPVVGKRCESAEPAHDSNGVVTDPDCFDTNPGTWHIALLNLIGLRRQPLFMDRSSDGEVWNVPILGYQLSYFSPSAGGFFSSGGVGEPTDRLEDAMISIDRYRRDRFASHRSSRAVWVVGVQMTVNVAMGRTLARDAKASQPLRNYDYRYDLELDANGAIVGGEWYQDSHPDFLWAVNPDFRPLSMGDRFLASQSPWDGSAIPASWLTPIQMASRKSQPLERIVRKLIELSNRSAH